MKKTKQNDLYVAPVAECIELQTEQCIAASIDTGGDLGVMDPNDLLGEFGLDTGLMNLGI